MTIEATTFAIVGAGRIGRLHAANILGSDEARLVAVIDPDDAAAQSVATRHPGSSIYPSLENAVAATNPDAVMITSPTDTHVNLIKSAASKGHAVFCEKPVDLSMHNVLSAAESIARHGIPFMIGFHRRRDPSHSAARTKVAAGEIGRLIQIRLSARDPGPPPLHYLKRSGGIFRDMMIHDIDQLRFLSGTEFTHVHAIGGRVFDPQTFAAADDFDIATATFWNSDGLVAVVQNARSNPAGFEQKVELFGTEGTLRIDGPSRTLLTVEDSNGRAADTLHHHFPERYADAYRTELSDFVAAVRGATVPSPGMNDAIRSLAMADAADLSARTGEPVRIDPVSAQTFSEVPA